jgi:acyl-CoA synthetase (AMP-forming)/AMP-acid ligase II
MSDGHAAVGQVVGTRLPDGSRPKYVHLTYRKDGELGEAVVCRESGIQQVEDTPSDTVRFVRKGGRELRVDEVVETEPVEPEVADA